MFGGLATAPARKRRTQVLGQGRNIVDPIAQRRQRDLERVDAEHQVLAKLLLGDHLLQVAMGGADDADIDFKRLVVADAADLAAFEHAQQLGLHGLGQFADLVEEQRAAVGDFEQTRRGGRRRR